MSSNTFIQLHSRGRTQTQRDTFLWPFLILTPLPLILLQLFIDTHLTEVHPSSPATEDKTQTCKQQDPEECSELIWCMGPDFTYPPAPQKAHIPRPPPHTQTEKQREKMCLGSLEATRQMYPPPSSDTTTDLLNSSNIPWAATRWRFLAQTYGKWAV